MEYYRFLTIPALILSIVSCSHKQGIKPENLLCEFRECPAGVGSSPAFSWTPVSAERHQYQSAFHLLISDNQSDINKNKGNVFDSGIIRSSQSNNNRFAGPVLEPGEKYFWKVEVWDRTDRGSGWSDPSGFITGLFNEADWCGAEWIGYEDVPDSLLLIPGVHGSGNELGEIGLKKAVIPMIRKEFAAREKIASAYLFISGLGHYKAYLNGQVISEDFLSPGWTDYRDMCLYNTYEITRYLTKGLNAIGIITGNGFYNINRERYRKFVIAYGMPSVIARIKITYDDGSVESIVTGSDWKAAPSPVTYSSMYGGEDYDARLEQPGWNRTGFNDHDWKNAVLMRDPGGRLVPEITHPVRVMETFLPANIIQTGQDTFLYDFGQNASGITNIRVQGERAGRIRLIPGELTDVNGHVSQIATGSPYYFDYTLRGGREENWQPMFSYTGSRYVQVTGAVPAKLSHGTGRPEIIELKFLHTYSSAPKAGRFTCSNELFNRINDLIRYAIQSNLQSVVTDCPHREKLGWLEQTYLMGGSIHYNFNLHTLYMKQVRDMISARTGEGLIPDIAPEFVLFEGGFRDSPEWGSAGVILPWLIYRWYGDPTMMNEAWPMIMDYIAYLGKKADGHILSHGLGDWYDLGPERPGYAQLTPVGLSATATYYLDVTLASQMAGILNHENEQKILGQLAGEIKSAFNNTFFNRETGVYATGSQTAMAMPLSLGLVEKEYYDLVLNNLVDSIHANDKALTAGDVGFHYLVEALTLGGQSQLLYDMINRDDVPGYGYQLKKGATALTESWAALEAVSNNHLMLGHIMQWFYEGLAGIRQADDDVACREMVIRPAFAGDLTYVHAEFMSPNGRIRSGWERQEGMIIMTVEIPVNTTARIFLPSDNPHLITENKVPLSEVNGLRITGTTDGMSVIETGSGIYEFEIKISQSALSMSHPHH
jgi:hypothetical protein